MSALLSSGWPTKKKYNIRSIKIFTYKKKHNIRSRKIFTHDQRTFRQWLELLWLVNKKNPNIRSRKILT